MTRDGEGVDLAKLLTVAEFEAIARERLPAGAYVYVSGGSGDERTMRDNIEAFTRWQFIPRVLVDTTRRDLSTTLLGRDLALPVGIAPFALQGLLHAEGEVATARAATSANIFMALSMGANRTIEEVGAAARCPLWFQPYLFDDRVYMRELAERAERAGYVALCLTVDSPVSGRRDGALRVPATLPDGMTWANMPPELRRPSGSWLRGGEAWSWDDVDRIRDATRLGLVVKGILHPDDAVRAVEHGARAIVVSNHGGRQLDDSIASLDALPAIVDAVAGRAEVVLDGGVRRGIDVLKALALGARAVLIGRATAWGLSVGGQAGVERVLELLRVELSVAMAIAGVTSVRDVPRALLVQRNARAS
jgi:4-hydroxymandelate oxidase